LNKNIHILQELKEIAPTLAGIETTMPNAIPTAYFKQFLANITALVSSNFIGKLPKQQVYQVPANYFSNLPTQVLEAINKDIASTNIPANYFNNLANTILQKAKAIDVADELNLVAPLLNKIDKNPVQHLPNGYFDTLTITAEIPIAKLPKLATVKRINWLKYAAAACVASLLSVAAYNYVAPAPTNTLASNININAELAKVADSTIENYANNIATLYDDNTMAYNQVKDEDITEILQAFTEEELQQYLDKQIAIEN
jgi:hypothetical protein